VLELKGNFLLSGGTFENSSAAGLGSVLFAKTGTQVYTKTGGTISSAINFTVNAGSTLSMATNVLDGSTGTFTLSSGGGLETAHVSGITLTDASGSIQVSGSRTYNTGANYTFNGSSAQSTGNGFTGANNLTINNAAGVTLTSSASLAGTLTLTSGTFTVGSGNTITVANNGSITQSSGSLASGTGAGTFTFSGTGTVSGTIGFNNVNIAGGVNFGSASTINGTLTINAGGFVNTNAPTYASGSTLKYNTGSVASSAYGRSDEWNSTSGSGYPFHVQLSGNTWFDLGNGGTSTLRQIGGSLTIDAGSGFLLDFNTNDMSQPLVVLGNVLINGTLSLSDALGGGLKVSGNFTNNGTFNPKGRTVEFTGSSAQTIAGSLNGVGTSDNFYYLTISNTSGGLSLNSSVAITNTLNLNTGIFDIGSNTLTNGGTITKTSGSIDADAGTVAFTNASNLSLPTTVFSGSIATLSKTSGAGTLTINDNCSITNLNTTASTGAVILAADKQLTVTGTLTNNGTLTLENGATLLQTGSTANAVGGTYNVKQVIDGSGGATPNGRGWYMGSPVSGASSNLFAPSGSGNKIFHWEANQSSPAWVQHIANEGATLVVGKGYAVRIGETSTITFSSSTINNAPSSTPITIPCYKQTSTTYQGYNLVCNPFPSYLDWNDVWTNTNASNFESTIYYRVANGSNVMVFDTYNALNGQGTANTSGLGSNSSGSYATRYIPPMQAFWVKLGSSVAASSNAVNLTLNNSMRDHYTSVASGWTAGLKSTAQDFPMFLRLNIEQGSFKDQMLVFLKQQASSQYDAYDSEKMFLSGYPQVYTKVGTRKLVFNGLNSNKKITVIPVIVDIPTSGVFTFRADEFNVEDGLILLEDKQEGITQDLTINDVYTFYADAGTISNRFFIRFHQLDPSITAQGPSNSWVQDENEINEGGSIVVATNGRGKVTIQQDIDPLASKESHVVIRDAAGREFLRDKLSGIESIFQLNVPSGVYFVEVQLNGQVEVKKIFVQQ